MKPPGGSAQGMLGGDALSEVLGFVTPIDYRCFALSDQGFPVYRGSPRAQRAPTGMAGDIVGIEMSTAMPSERAEGPADLVAVLEANIARVIRGKPAAIRHAVIALLARGHLLIEDVPGVGKTTLARALAASIGVSFHRIQFTSDLLPSDIVGVSVLDPKSGQFEFRKGAIFANLVLADEINRTTPRTQSALLEAMNDGQVSVDGRTYPLEAPFLVIATQNPEEHYGTYPLPESQMDRFLLRIRMDYPSPEDEKRILLESPGRAADALASLGAVLRVADVRALQDATDRVHLSP